MPSRPARRLGVCLIVFLTAYVLVLVRNSFSPLEDGSDCDPMGILSTCVNRGEDEALDLVRSKCQRGRSRAVRHDAAVDLFMHQVGATRVRVFTDCVEMIRSSTPFYFQRITLDFITSATRRQLGNVGAEIGDNTSAAPADIDIDECVPKIDQSAPAAARSGTANSNVGGYIAHFEHTDAERYTPNTRILQPDEPIVIIGGGPTGLCAAARLEELGHRNWTLLEAKHKASGLAQSVKDDKGFTWDVGVHIGFSHYEFFDQILDRAVPQDEWHVANRSSPIFMRKQLVQYPLQLYFWQLGDAVTDEVVGSIESELAPAQNCTYIHKPSNFEHFVLRQYGQALASLFMLPYNRKVWAHEPKTMNTAWVGERVAPLNVATILQHAKSREPFKASWGPNARFRYPLHGTGQVWESLFSLLPKERAHLRRMVRSISRIPIPAGVEGGADASGEGVAGWLKLKVEDNVENGAARVTRDQHQRVGMRSDGGFSGGNDDARDPPAPTSDIVAKAVLSTMPIDRLLEVVDIKQGDYDYFKTIGLASPDASAPLPDLMRSDGVPGRFVHTRLHLVGFGFKGDPPSTVAGHHWIYFPEDVFPFYRMTVMSALSPGLHPPDTWSLMFEVSESEVRPFKYPNRTALEDAILESLFTNGMIPRQTPIARFYHFEWRGYPVPYIDRNKHIHELDNVLRSGLGVWSRGRFGSWKYEVSNQDHSCMLGVEAVDAMIFNSTEKTFLDPNAVNAVYRTHSSTRHASVDSQLGKLGERRPRGR